MALKPIIHGGVDPMEIPYYCKKCQYYDNSGTAFPRCTRREDGRFVPAVAYSCRKPIGLNHGFEEKPGPASNETDNNSEQYKPEE